MRRRYLSDFLTLKIFLAACSGLTILGSLGLYFADRPLLYKAVAGVVLLIILIAVGVILWGRHKARKFDATYDAITKIRLDIE